MDETDLSQTVVVLRSPLVLEQVLRGYDFFRGLAEPELARVVSTSQVASHKRGAVLHEESGPADRLLVVLRGRVDVLAVQPGGTVRALGTLGPGGHFGELGLLTGARLALRAVAATDVLALQIPQLTFEELLKGAPAFAESMSRTLGLRLLSTSAGRKRGAVPAVIGLAGPSRRAPQLSAALRSGLRARQAPFAIIDGDSQPGLASASTQRSTRVRNVAELRAGHDLVLLQFVPGLEQRSAEPSISSCEELWWIVDPDSAAEGLRALADLLEHRPSLDGRCRLIWALREGERPLTGSRPGGLLAPDYRVFLSATGVPTARRERLSLRRVIGALEGVRLGLALGGGGARGLAHCGVLKVLDEEGLAIDRIVGTSIGALVGMLYATGMPPDEVAASIARAAHAPWWLRHFPKGQYLNLWFAARSGSYERSLRNACGNITFDELDLPLQAVVSDLLHGEVVLREAGDCIRSVLESINLPVFSRPILRDGRFLADGGILNNLPSDVLVAQEIEAVIAVDVLAQSMHEQRVPARAPGRLESVLRVAELQHARLSAQGAGTADLVIRAHTSAYSLADFSPQTAPVIVAAGEVAARSMLAQIRSLVPALWRGRESSERVS